MYARQCADHVTCLTPFNRFHVMGTHTSHFRELIEGEQLLKVTDITQGRTRIPAQSGLSSNQGCLTRTYTSSGSLWKEFRNSMNLDGEKCACLFSFTSNWNWTFSLIMNADNHRSICNTWILSPIKSTDVFVSQFSCCKYLKIAFIYHFWEITVAYL